MHGNSVFAKRTRQVLRASRFLALAVLPLCLAACDLITGAQGADGAPGTKGDQGERGAPGPQGAPGRGGEATGSRLHPAHYVGSDGSAMPLNGWLWDSQIETYCHFDVNFSDLGEIRCWPVAYTAEKQGGTPLDLVGIAYIDAACTKRFLSAKWWQTPTAEQAAQRFGGADLLYVQRSKTTEQPFPELTATIWSIGDQIPGDAPTIVYFADISGACSPYPDNDGKPLLASPPFFETARAPAADFVKATAEHE